MRRWRLLLSISLVLTGACGSSGSTDGPVKTDPPDATNGIIWHEGRLWISSLFGAQLVQVHPETGAVTRSFDAEDGLVGNDDLVAIGGGAFVLTEPFEGTVSRFHPRGGRTVIAEIGAQANGIARCEDGRVFVSREVNRGGVFEVDPSGEQPARLVTQDVPALNSMACVGDELFAPTFELAGKVLRIHRETGATVTLSTGLVLPAAVHPAPDGTLIALQSILPARLVDVDSVTGALTDRARITGQISDNFAVGPDGTLYVTDFLDAGVLVIHPDGSTQRFEL